MQELSVNLYCVQMRSGVEIWVEFEKVEKLQKILSAIKQSTFIHFEDQTINSADVVGIFKADTMQEFTKRKNGGWKCSLNTWHEKSQKCECFSEESRIRRILEEDNYKTKYGTNIYPLP